MRTMMVVASGIAGVHNILEFIWVAMLMDQLTCDQGGKDYDDDVEYDGKNSGHLGWNIQNLGLLKLLNAKTLPGIYMIW